jgi:hypothetical protein
VKLMVKIWACLLKVEWMIRDCLSLDPSKIFKTFRKSKPKQEEGEDGNQPVPSSTTSVTEKKPLSDKNESPAENQISFSWPLSTLNCISTLKEMKTALHGR